MKPLKKKLFLPEENQIQQHWNWILGQINGIYIFYKKKSLASLEVHLSRKIQ